MTRLEFKGHEVRPRGSCWLEELPHHVDHGTFESRDAAELRALQVAMIGGYDDYVVSWNEGIES